MSSMEKTQIDYELQGAAPGASSGSNKRGHKCCGGCCDVRRAVIVLNMVTLGLMLMALISVIAGNTAAQYVQDVDDDEVKAMLDEWDTMSIGSLIALCVVRIVFCVCGVAGAYYFNFWLVGAAGLMYVAGAIWGLVSLSFLDVIFQGLFAYPHYFLVKEIREGIMTKENYHNEEQSCCCA